MTKLILLIGLPGSGKTTLAKKLLAECPQLRLISTDTIRGQLFGNEAIKGSWLLIGQEVERQFQQAILSGNGVIYDATNTRRDYRRETIALARESGFTEIIALWLNTPIWLCLARNKKRKRQVPEDVIFRMHRQLRDAPPRIEEGIDLIICSSEQEYGNCADSISNNRTLI
ncbi:AAA family ATPase [Iningainema tapete]|uniref:AAA family ATPase n=1 Tax=Iningainema tapete BLCC-T55 TaxID=2748662 RepID=A0A8J6XD30_9CYAN|nr:AAA family ATPase [Iningainema tapete]MBD2770845.1 AAA family ATPase [Iningainema tapete BLCC-T55]